MTTPTASTTLTLTLVHDTTSGQLSGSGFLGSGASATALNATGVYAAPNVSVTLSATGFQSMNLAGQHQGTQITGSANGSGYNNSPFSLSKQ